MVIRYAWAILVIAGTATAAFGKCPVQRFRVSGEIRSVQASPIPWQSIVVFLGSRAATGVVVRRDLEADQGSNAFNVDATYDTFQSTGFFGDKCVMKPDAVEIVIVFDNFGAQRKILTPDDFTIQGSGQPPLLRLVPVLVEPPQSVPTEE